MVEFFLWLHVYFYPMKVMKEYNVKCFDFEIILLSFPMMMMSFDFHYDDNVINLDYFSHIENQIIFHTKFPRYIFVRKHVRYARTRILASYIVFY